MGFDIVLDTNKLQLEGLWGSILCNIGTPSESNIKPQSPVLYSEVFIHVLPLQPSQAMSMLWIKSGPASELSPHPLSMTSLLALLSVLQTPTPARTNLPLECDTWEWHLGTLGVLGSGLFPGPFSFSSRLKEMDPAQMSPECEKHLWSALISHIIINLAFMSWFYEMELRISKIKHILLFFYSLLW